MQFKIGKAKRAIRSQHYAYLAEIMTSALIFQTDDVIALCDRTSRHPIRYTRHYGPYFRSEVCLFILPRMIAINISNIVSLDR